MASILSLEEVGIKDVGAAGLKAASLGQLRKAGLPVAKGFVITTSAYKEFLVESGIAARVFSILKSYKHSRVAQVSEKIGEIMMNYPIPEGLRKEITEKISEMGMRRVVARASSIDGKSNCASLNLRGEEEIISAVKRCWASLYSPENLVFKTRKPRNDSIAVLVQEMLFAEKGGVIATSDEEIRVEAVHGMSSVIDLGIGNASFIFGTKELDRRGFSEIAQEYALLKHWKDDLLIKKEALPRQPVTENEALNIAQLGKSVHLCYRLPQRVEFLVKENRTYIVNCKKI